MFIHEDVYMYEYTYTYVFIHVYLNSGVHTQRNGKHGGSLGRQAPGPLGAPPRLAHSRPRRARRTITAYIRGECGRGFGWRGRETAGYEPLAIRSPPALDHSPLNSPL